MGVELNMVPARHPGEKLTSVLRPFRIAKRLGCKFYFGGDAHHPESFATVLSSKMQPLIDLLELEENDKLPYIPQTIARMQSEAKF
jgi:hypothetical protein